MRSFLDAMCDEFVEGWESAAYGDGDSPEAVVPYDEGSDSYHRFIAGWNEYNAKGKAPG